MTQFTHATYKNSVNVERIDSTVLDQVCDLASNESFLRGLSEEYHAEQEKKRIAALPQIPSLNKALSELLKKREGIDRAFLTGMVTPENSHYWNCQLKETNHEIDRIEGEIKRFEIHGQNTKYLPRIALCSKRMGVADPVDL